MIQEFAVLDVVESKVADFLAAFERAQSLVEQSPGYVSHQLSRCIENESRFMLCIHWQTLEDHIHGFRESEQYLQWKKMLHHFYEPFPVVEHYEEVLPARAT